ncbi:hypothetical protein EVAR_92140_1 [Eumeta japonica]|uniref:Uncharacterized protein n=1 Tax=Eumeta variegata TaxID=151549 RepID=A0A4C1SZA3_EUMVA|nr:hypothetical protein EVAR_92140_1 [Eumeta japonica]
MGDWDPENNILSVRFILAVMSNGQRMTHHPSSILVARITSVHDRSWTAALVRCPPAPRQIHSRHTSSQR